MLKTDTLYTGKEARDRLISGIRKIRDAVGGTMGASGANAIIEAIEHPYHGVTNDGYTIASKIRLSDPIEEMGRQILVEAIERSNKASGDGSSTTTVLTAAILEEGLKQLESYSPMDIKRSLEACIPLIEEALLSQRKMITPDEVGQVATISAEDPSIGARIQEIYKEIGKDGIIHWDVSKTGEDYHTIGTGITVEGATYASPYMCDADAGGQNTNRIRLPKPQVLVLNQKVSSAADFESLATQLNAKNIKDLVVFVDDIDPLVIPQLVMTRMQRGFRIVVIKLPTYFKDEWFEDLAKASGANLIDAKTGMALKDAKLEHLGSFENITVTKDETYIDGIQDLSAHIESLKAEATEQSVLRAARLNTKTARYYVGALSDSALYYRRLKVEDAIAAAYHALNSGIVVGGGLALASIEIPSLILEQALQAPYKQICANMGVKGFTKEKIEEQHVYDPYQIVLNSVKNAISVAATVLTANSIVLLPKDQV